MLKKKDKYNIGIVGATGLVGCALIKLLEKSELKINNIYFFASKNSISKKILFNNIEHNVLEFTTEYYDKIDIIFFATPSNISSKYIPKIINQNILIIDNSSYYRLMRKIPLVVPIINSKSMMYSKLISNPNCSTIESVIPLFVINKLFKIKKIIYNTYQSVSGSGYKGLNDYYNNTTTFYPYKIKETCIPIIGKRARNNYTEEETKMIDETKKILNLKNVQIYATCVRVPIVVGHGISIFVKTKKKIDYNLLIENFKKLNYIKIKDNLDNNICPTSIDTFDNDYIYVGRIRIIKNTINFYVTSNNILRGAASNALEIAYNYINNLN